MMPVAKQAFMIQAWYTCTRIWQLSSYAPPLARVLLPWALLLPPLLMSWALPACRSLPHRLVWEPVFTKPVFTNFLHRNARCDYLCSRWARLHVQGRSHCGLVLPNPRNHLQRDLFGLVYHSRCSTAIELAKGSAMLLACHTALCADTLRAGLIIPPCGS